MLCALSFSNVFS